METFSRKISKPYASSQDNGDPFTFSIRSQPNIIHIFKEILMELKIESQGLTPSYHLLGSESSKNVLSHMIDECFFNTEENGFKHPMIKLTRSEQNGLSLFLHSKNLVLECLKIIECVINQEYQNKSDHSDLQKKTSAKSAKAMLLSIMAGIQKELSTSQIIALVVNTHLHQPSFKFIDCLLKYFVHQAAKRKKLREKCQPPSYWPGSSTAAQSIHKLGLPTENDKDPSYTLCRLIVESNKIDGYLHRLDNLTKSCPTKNFREIGSNIGILNNINACSRNEKKPKCNKQFKVVPRLLENIKKEVKDWCLDKGGNNGWCIQKQKSTKPLPNPISENENYYYSKDWYTNNGYLNKLITACKNPKIPKTTYGQQRVLNECNTIKKFSQSNSRLLDECESKFSIIQKSNNHKWVYHCEGQRVDSKSDNLNEKRVPLQSKNYIKTLRDRNEETWTDGSWEGTKGMNIPNSIKSLGVSEPKAEKNELSSQCTLSKVSEGEHSAPKKEWAGSTSREHRIHESTIKINNQASSWVNMTNNKSTNAFTNQSGNHIPHKQLDIGEAGSTCHCKPINSFVPVFINQHWCGEAMSSCHPMYQLCASTAIPMCCCIGALNKIDYGTRKIFLTKETQTYLPPSRNETMPEPDLQDNIHLSDHSKHSIGVLVNDSKNNMPSNVSLNIPYQDNDHSTPDMVNLNPSKIEEMFLEFDDKHSQVVQELKRLEKHSYIPLKWGYQEEDSNQKWQKYTLTHEISVSTTELLTSSSSCLCNEVIEQMGNGRKDKKGNNVTKLLHQPIAEESLEDLQNDRTDTEKAKHGEELPYKINNTLTFESSCTCAFDTETESIHTYEKYPILESRTTLNQNCNEAVDVECTCEQLSMLSIKNCGSKGTVESFKLDKTRMSANFPGENHRRVCQRCVVSKESLKKGDECLNMRNLLEEVIQENQDFGSSRQMADDLMKNEMPQKFEVENSSTSEKTFEKQFKNMVQTINEDKDTKKDRIPLEGMNPEVVLKRPNKTGSQKEKQREPSHTVMRTLSLKSCLGCECCTCNIDTETEVCSVTAEKTLPSEWTQSNEKMNENVDEECTCEKQVNMSSDDGSGSAEKMESFKLDIPISASFQNDNPKDFNHEAVQPSDESNKLSEKEYKESLKQSEPLEEVYQENHDFNSSKQSLIDERNMTKNRESEMPQKFEMGKDLESKKTSEKTRKAKIQTNRVDKEVKKERMEVPKEEIDIEELLKREKSQEVKLYVATTQETETTTTGSENDTIEESFTSVKPECFTTPWNSQFSSCSVIDECEAIIETMPCEYGSDSDCNGDDSDTISSISSDSLPNV